MSTPEDEKFEFYLKEFHPLTPAPLPAHAFVRVPRSSRPLQLWGAFAFAVLIIGIAGVLMQLRHIPEGPKAGNEAPAGLFVPTPLTLRSANASLASAPSYKAALDNMAFRSQSSTVPQGKQSAVAILAKEKIKL